ncbi:hypothetical protein [Novosphingobium gossypii]|uniref:hypothetical protein n=1 Tax=Novosphingobium gossypii TaxID=1604774 RepID=UPI003D1A356C
MLPYDGTPEGDALGMMFDDDMRRNNRNLFETPDFEEASEKSSALQVCAYFTAGLIILLVILYGTVG